MRIPGVLTWLTLLAHIGRAHATPDELPAAAALVAVRPPTPLWAQQALQAARQSEGARFTLHTLTATPPADEVAPALESLRGSYLDADFLSCLAAGQESALDLDELLGSGDRTRAAEATMVRAACLHATGDRRRARALVERLHGAELVDLAPARARLRPDFLAFVESLRAPVWQGRRIKLRIVTKPADARVLVDGDDRRCLRAPCTVELLAGTHLIAVERLGLRRQLVRQTFTTDDELMVGLDEAPGAEARVQLAAALAAGAAPDAPDVSRAAAVTFGAEVVLFVWPARGASASLYDRTRDRVVARATAPDGDVGAAVRLVTSTWQRQRAAVPLTSRPAFWILSAAALAGGALAAFFALRTYETRYDLVVR